ncbi:MAG: AraC family transcriptional regulator [Bacillota bacterium]|nr:MAG: AraC family transcriptional regulator [Bacillota bacterium]
MVLLLRSQDSTAHLREMVKNELNWLSHVNQAMDIDENISQDIDMSAIAKLVHCSANHFERVFSFIAGVTLKDTLGSGV